MKNVQQSSWPVFRIFGCLLIVTLLWFAIIGENGFVDLFKLHRSKQDLEGKVAEIERQNQVLRDEIKALKDKDNKEVERIARRDLGMVGDDEIMYQFKDDNEKSASKQDKENQQR